MKKNKMSTYVVWSTLSIATLIGLQGCAKKVKPDESPVSNSASAEDGGFGDSDSGKADGLQTIHFAYNSDLLDAQAKSELKSNAKILHDKPQLKIQIEGNCDQHGGIQYNLALGEKRAKSTQHFLMDLGIPENRMSIISYGKEHLLDRAETEEADAKNRRANFAITSK